MKLKLYPTKEDWVVRREKLKNWFFQVDGLTRKISLTPKAQLLLAIILVMAIVAVADWPVLSCQAMTYDDGEYWADNALVKAVNWESCRRFLTEVFAPSSVGGYYMPLTMISLMADYLFGGETRDLTVFHRTNLALHVMNAALVAIFIYLLFRNVWAAALTGLLFGLHPMTVESLAWITERKTLLATLFSMGTLIFYLQYCRSEHKPKRYLFLALVMYILAMMSKPISIPLPLVMLLFDYWPLQRFQKRSISEKTLFYLFGILFTVIAYISQKNTCVILAPTQNPLLLNEGKFNMLRLPLEIAWQVFFYITKFFWPFPVTHRYPFPKLFAINNPAVLFSLFGMLLITVLCVKIYPRFKALAIGLMIFLVMLLPTTGILGVVANTLVSDRYVYLASIGFLVILGAFFDLIRQKWPFLKRPLWLGAGLLLIITGEIYSLRSYLPAWKDSETLARYSVRMSPDDPYAWDSLGLVLMKKKDYQGAIAAYQNAIKLEPKTRMKIYYALGQAYFANGNYLEALASYKYCIKLEPQLYLPYYYIGALFFIQKKYEEAISWYNQALERDPENFYVTIALSQTYRAMGNSAKADYFFTKANELLSKVR